jgi:hypothetical protein
VSTFEDARALALALPEVEEGTSWGSPAFKVRGKLFARLRPEDGLLMVRVADLGEKELLLRSEPEALTTTPHYDGYPSVLVRLEAVERDVLGELLEDAWRTRAPKRLLAERAGA